MTIKENIILEDTTLRDGEQAPGVAFSKETKVNIFNSLVEAGVKWIEAGIPAMKGDEVLALQEILERKDEVNIIGWNRGVLEDIKYSLSLGFKAIHIGLPTSNIHLKHSVSKDRNWLLTTSSDMIKFAKDKGIFVSISAEDVGRTEISFLQEYAGNVAEAGADRLRLSDTIGILNSQQYAQRVYAVREASSINLQCHCHNDFGLAVANTLAGLEAGARYFHVCVNAMGERAGMPDLSQMVMALQHFYQIDVGVDTQQLTSLSHKVAQASGYSISPWQPIVGSNVFAHESGIHVNGMLKDSKTFEPFEPTMVGGQRRMVIGKHSGRAVLQNILEKRGIEIVPQALEHCLSLVRKAAEKHPGGIPAHTLCELYRQAEGAIE
ncbi:hypothetical protein ID858_16570 [Xenorhabdus sp. DI]|uniref:homocitrate synthase/isopropylmalate synthase family protein n=1 Tax=Xenorhabdus doucetiae TaxID=351671 RepID=UPI001984E34F|nr:MULTISPECIES: hypothetical protein [unclassified Xenorhabdus]MBD2786488.1 hypothetical protein [Xenorhabdus sp. 3]MBD2790107.1 hypothetical protein [Xenorhabdus sp. DI]